MKKVTELLAPVVDNTDLYRGINLRKLVFPYLCTFWLNGKRHIGLVSKGWSKANRDVYELHSLRQGIEGGGTINRITDNPNLRQLLETWDVEFRDGEIILYDINE